MRPSTQFTALLAAIAAIGMALPWTTSAAGLNTLSTAVACNVVTLTLMLAARRSLAFRQNAPSIALILYEADHESD